MAGIRNQIKRYFVNAWMKIGFQKGQRESIQKKKKNSL